MVEHTVAVVACRCDPVFVIAASGQVLPELAAIVLRDEARGLGPLVATGRGLRAAAAAGCGRAFVAAVDMPDLSGDVIDLLAHQLHSVWGDVDVVLPWDGRDHYLAGVYRTALADRIDALAENGARSMRALTDSVVTRRVKVPTSSLTNLNREADLQ
jgi:molybdopterin-guanine dinucleotide biosynthesis protein A